MALVRVLVYLTARLSLQRLPYSGVHIGGGCAGDGVRGLGLGGFFAVRAFGQVVVGLAGGLGDGVRLEGAVGGGAAGGEGFGVEFGGGVVADEDAGFVLGGG